MKSNKKGFTLVEVILVISIVGIITVITIPMLARLKNQDGAILGRAIEQIELGCQNIIQEYNSDVEGASYAQTLLAADFQGESTLASAVRAEEVDTNTYSFSNVVGWYKIENFDDKASDELDSEIADITIDTNGFEKKPNTNGTDQFNFKLLNSGKLLPADDEAKEIIKSGFKIEKK